MAPRKISKIKCLNGTGCAVCGQPLPKGNPIWWVPSQKLQIGFVFHLGCLSDFVSQHPEMELETCESLGPLG